MAVDAVSEPSSAPVAISLGPLSAAADSRADRSRCGIYSADTRIRTLTAGWRYRPGSAAATAAASSAPARRGPVGSGSGAAFASPLDIAKADAADLLSAPRSARPSKIILGGQVDLPRVQSRRARSSVRDPGRRAGDPPPDALYRGVPAPSTMLSSAYSALGLVRHPQRPGDREGEFATVSSVLRDCRRRSVAATWRLGCTGGGGGSGHAAVGFGDRHPRDQGRVEQAQATQEPCDLNPALDQQPLKVRVKSWRSPVTRAVARAQMRTTVRRRLRSREMCRSPGRHRSPSSPHRCELSWIADERSRVRPPRPTGRTPRRSSQRCRHRHCRRPPARPRRGPLVTSHARRG